MHTSAFNLPNCSRRALAVRGTPLHAAVAMLLVLSTPYALHAPSQPSSRPFQQVNRRMAVASLGALSLVAQAPAALGDEMNAFDYLSPARLAVKAMQQKPQECYDAGECLDTKPYYAIECDREDVDCLQRKRRLASQEFRNFRIDPTSSPILLLATGAFVFQWGSAAVRIGASLLKRADAEGDDER